MLGNLLLLPPVLPGLVVAAAAALGVVIFAGLLGIFGTAWEVTAIGDVFGQRVLLLVA